jgi:transcriptional antiterminator/mannitol/fructose-specific phosphotransferase system IIA component (Ntr-type)
MLDQKEYVSAKYLATKFDVSIRTIRYDLELVEDWLNENKSTLVKVPNKGMLIKTKAGKEILLERLKFISVENRVLSEKERIRFIALEFLTHDSELTIAEVSESLLLSRNTVMKVLKQVKTYFSENSLELVKVHAKGFKVVGHEIFRRRMVVKLFLEMFGISNVVTAMHDEDVREDLLTYCNNNFKDYPFESLTDVFSALLDVEEKFNYYLTDFAVAKMIVYLTVMIHRIKGGHTIYESPILAFDDVEKNIALSISEKLMDIYDIEVSEDEINEIANRLIESKSFISYGPDAEYSLYTYTSEIDTMSKHIIEYCENELNVRLINDSQLINDLSVHLKSSLMRIKNNKQLENDLSDEITKRFPIVYQIVEESLKKFGNYKFATQEVAYIALHIRAAYERNYEENYMSTALVICGEGVSVLNILASTLQRNIPELKIIKTCATSDYAKYKKDIDLVITTSNFKAKSVEVVKVSPFLENEDIYNIRKTLVKLNKFKQIYKYNERKQFEGGRIILLEDLLNLDMIHLNVEANDWEDAIRKASGPIVDNKSVESKYVDNMIQAVNELGPYIVIMPEVAFAHARPDETVNKTCMSMITLKTPVEFGSESNDPVSVVFSFAAENGNDHVKALQDLAKYLAHEENVEYLKGATDREEVLSKLVNI